jgi:streptomycin 6-kinase
MPDSIGAAGAFGRLAERARAWSVTLDDTRETETAVIGAGHRDGIPVVLKIVKTGNDEWRSGAILRAFDGRGTVRIFECVDGALLLERIAPGDSLERLTIDGRDDEAVDIVADVIRRMGSTEPPPGCATVEQWGEAFSRYLASGDRRIPRRLVEEGQRQFAVLSASQRSVRLLHGDLHHDNVLADAGRGWLAIDPKGVVGEVEYELGAFFRNPIARPDLVIEPAIVERRLDRFARALDVDRDRTLAWVFAQAVLSAIWTIEDGFDVSDARLALDLAAVTRMMND